MKKVFLVLGLVMSLVSCSGDSMDIPEPKVNEWFFKATLVTTTTIGAYYRETTTVKEEVIFETDGISFDEVKELKDEYYVVYEIEKGTDCNDDGTIQVSGCRTWNILRKVRFEYNVTN